MCRQQGECLFLLALLAIVIEHAFLTESVHCSRYCWLLLLSMGPAGEHVGSPPCCIVIASCCCLVYGCRDIVSGVVIVGCCMSVSLAVANLSCLLPAVIFLSAAAARHVSRWGACWITSALCYCHVVGSTKVFLLTSTRKNC